MLFELIGDVISATSILAEEVKPSHIVAPEPEYRLVWDEDEGRIKLEEKKRPFFDPKQY